MTDVVDEAPAISGWPVGLPTFATIEEERVRAKVAERERDLATAV
jgi:hypothetical protein